MLNNPYLLTTWTGYLISRTEWSQHITKFYLVYRISSEDENETVLLHGCPQVSSDLIQLKIIIIIITMFSTLAIHQTLFWVLDTQCLNSYKQCSTKMLLSSNYRNRNGGLKKLNLPNVTTQATF